MKLRELSKLYIDQNGFMQNRDKGQDGNLVLYTGTYYALLSRLGELDQYADMLSFRRTMKEVEVESGVIIRAYKPNEWQADDDYRGACVASFFVEPPDRTESFAKRVLVYGRRTKWNWLGPEGKWYNWHPKAFFARKPSFKPLIKACAGERLSIFEQALVCVDLLWTLYHDDGFSGYILDYLTILVMQDKKHNYWLVNQCINFHKKVFMKRYPLGMGEAFLQFFDAKYPFSITMIGVY